MVTQVIQGGTGNQGVDIVTALIDSLTKLAPQFGSGTTNTTGTSDTTNIQQVVQDLLNTLTSTVKGTTAGTTAGKTTGTTSGTTGQVVTSAADPKSIEMVNNLMKTILDQNTGIDDVTKNILTQAMQEFGPNIAASLGAGNRALTDTTLAQLQAEAAARATGTAASAKLQAIQSANATASNLATAVLNASRTQTTAGTQQQTSAQDTTQATTQATTQTTDTTQTQKGATNTVAAGTTKTSGTSKTAASPIGTAIGGVVLGTIAAQQAKKLFNGEGSDILSALGFGGSGISGTDYVAGGELYGGTTTISPGASIPDPGLAISPGPAPAAVITPQTSVTGSLLGEPTNYTVGATVPVGEGIVSGMYSDVLPGKELLTSAPATAAVNTLGAGPSDAGLGVGIEDPLVTGGGSIEAGASLGSAIATSSPEVSAGASLMNALAPETITADAGLGTGAGDVLVSGGGTVGAEAGIGAGVGDALSSMGEYFTPAAYAYLGVKGLDFISSLFEDPQGPTKFDTTLASKGYTQSMDTESNQVTYYDPTGKEISGLDIADLLNKG